MSLDSAAEDGEISEALNSPSKSSENGAGARRMSYFVYIFSAYIGVGSAAFAHLRS